MEWNSLGRGTFSRRNFFRFSGGAGAAMLASRSAKAADSNDHLLDEVERRACRYFFELADPTTGLVLDRALTTAPYAPSVASIAATGFGLSALAIADSRNYFERDKLHARTLATVKFLCDQTAQEHGFFYHFLDSSTGQRIWKSEASSVDTAWLLCGALHTLAYWKDTEIRKYASELLHRTDWQWMLNGAETLCHGWMPESGFLKYRWDAYSEGLAMYL